MAKDTKGMIADDTVEVLDYNGKEFVFSGVSETKKYTFINRIEKSGGKISTKVTKKTYCLVIGSSAKTMTEEYIEATKLNEEGNRILIITDKTMDQIWRTDAENKRKQLLTYDASKDIPLVEKPTLQQELSQGRSLALFSADSLEKAYCLLEELTQGEMPYTEIKVVENKKTTLLLEICARIKETNAGSQSLARLELAREGELVKLLCLDESNPGKLVVTDNEYHQLGFLEEAPAKIIVALIQASIASITDPPIISSLTPLSAKHRNSWTADLWITFRLEMANVYTQEYYDKLLSGLSYEWMPFESKDDEKKKVFPVSTTKGEQGYLQCIVRGLIPDLVKLRREFNFRSLIKTTGQNGVYELSLPEEDTSGNLLQIDRIIKKYPQIKLISFYADLYKTGFLTVYSAPGYPYITQYITAGVDPGNKSDSPWWNTISPLSRAVMFDSVLNADGGQFQNYMCPYILKWDALDYVRANKHDWEIMNSRDNANDDKEADLQASMHFACFEADPAVIDAILKDLLENGTGGVYYREDKFSDYSSDKSTIIIDNCPPFSRNTIDRIIKKYKPEGLVAWTDEGSSLINCTEYYLCNYMYSRKVYKCSVSNHNGMLEEKISRWWVVNTAKKLYSRTTNDSPDNVDNQKKDFAENGLSEIPKNSPSISTEACQFVKVRFEDNKSYTYSCDYVVRVGDTVMVEGSREGQAGIVAEILKSKPNSSALRFMRSVTKVLVKEEKDTESTTQGITEAIEIERKDKEEEERKAAEEAAQKAAEEATREKEEAERNAKKEADLIARTKAEEERKAAKEAERAAMEAERKRQEEEERQKKDAQKKYEKEFAAWESACRKAKENRKQFVQDILYKEVRVILQKAEEDKTRAIADANALKNEQMHRKMQAQNTLASLGLFRFSEKKKQKETIEDCERRIEEAQQAIAAAHDTYQNRIDSIDQAFWEEKEKQLRSQAEIKYPFPDKPIPPEGIEEKVSDLSPVDDDYDDDDNDVENTAIQCQKMLYKERILAYLRAVGEGRTATDVCNAIGYSSPQGTSSLLKQLRDEGRVESYVEKRVTYFKIDEKAGDYFPVDDDYDDDDDDYDDDMENTAIQIQNMSDKDKILAFLKKVGDWRTATDIANEFGWSQSKASALLKYLREGGHVESYIEKGITHFRISR